MSVIPAPLHRTVLRLAHPLARAIWRWTHPSVSGAYALITRDRSTPDETWLFITNTYKPGLTVPGGGIRRGESPRHAARRETAEEVGLELDAARFVLRDDFEIEYLHRRDHVYFFEVALQPGEAATAEADGREVAWAGFRRRDEAAQLDLVPPVRRFLEREED